MQPPLTKGVAAKRVKHRASMKLLRGQRMSPVKHVPNSVKLLLAQGLLLAQLLLLAQGPLAERVAFRVTMKPLLLLLLRMLKCRRHKAGRRTEEQRHPLPPCASRQAGQRNSGRRGPQVAAMQRQEAP